MQSIKLAALAEYLDATLHGDPSAEITRVAGIETAEPGDLTFVSNPKYAALARTTKATAILVEPSFPEVRPLRFGLTIRTLPSPLRLSFFIGLLTIRREFIPPPRSRPRQALGRMPISALTL
jgi:hypothetical protein